MAARRDKHTNTDGTAKPKSRLGSILLNLLITLGFIVGLAVLLYPTFSDWWNRRRNERLIIEYQQVMQQVDDGVYGEIMEDARAFNKLHTVNTFVDAFDDEGNYELHHPYDQMLNPTGNNVMGYIDVPKIGQRLAISHGTSNEVLDRGVGHIEGTSLPVGGENTHSVLAGHRGLPTAKIFTDLDQILVGDKFFIYVLDETLAYEVDQIEVRDPHDTELLGIERGKDLVTLFTCTPYGVNSHRMLVRGHRIPYEEADVEAQRRQRTLPERERPIVFAIAGLIILFIFLAVMRAILNAKDRKKREEETHRKIVEATETARLAAKEASKAAKAAEAAKDAALAAREATEKGQADRAVDRARNASATARDASDQADAYAKENEERAR